MQTIYTSVNNADLKPCGKKGQIHKEAPIPLIKSNYLGEYRTALEKAKVRKNLGIADENVLQWGSIEGTIENQKDLINYVKSTQNYTSGISPNIQTVTDALDYALMYLANFKSESDTIEVIQNTITEIQSDISSLKDEDTLVESKISDINNKIEEINQAIINIDVDRNIQNWIESSLKGSNTISYEDNTLQVIVDEDTDNAIKVSEGGLYVKDLESTVSNIQTVQDKLVTDVENVSDNVVYNTTLSDDTTSPTTVGGITKGTTVSSIKGKSLIEIVDTLLFPTYVRSLIYPTLTYNIKDQLVEVGSSVISREATFKQNDAGLELSRSESLTFNGKTTSLITTYSSLGKYVYTTTVKYDAGEYLVNNKGETTTSRVEAGSIDASVTLTTTYPWYIGNSNGLQKQSLVAFNTETEVEVYVGYDAIIKLPGSSTQLESFKVNGGLGYLDVDLTGWTESTEVLNGINYKVWTKNDSYSSVLPHKLKFILKS